MNHQYFRIWSSTWHVSQHIAIELLAPLPERILLVNMRPVQPYERAASKLSYAINLPIMDTVVSRQAYESSIPNNL
jgi:hypothetical protein